MPKGTNDITQRLKQERLKEFQENNLALSKKIAKSLDASQNVLRVVERAVGGKLIPARASRRRSN